MDLPNLARVRVARHRSDLVLSSGEAPLAGGTWLYSEPQAHLTGLVDLMELGWPAWTTRNDGGLSIAATCTVAELVRIPAAGRPAAALFRAGAESLLQSFKVWNTATIGGNLVTALAAGALIGVTAALDAELVIWTPDDGERRSAVERFVLGQRATTLAAGEVLRSIELPAGAMAARTAFRRIALSPLGRAGTVVAGRRDADGTTVLSITGGTARPEVLRFPEPPGPDHVVAAVDGIRTWFTDAHGAADWRAAMTRVLAEDVRAELAA
ncbi:FAD binding domain-containing protein [Amnibacterium sp.]|uniref:FAD binding domain-containing protein n=1 Tax=Amnibacterium sp. TaxID=1872496 RepID=UPI00261687EE|nr:FAD binding domain-containing protein [Amnibacterium sp.]MCU1472355.1 FAD-binding molybdopterin dehydrogenase [Amnibacterium sp.]